MNAVIVFVKYPSGGMVKTRLSKTLGTEFAVRFYKAMAQHTFQVCHSLPEKDKDLFLFYDNAEMTELVKKWVPAGFSFHLQEGNDLGGRMKAAFYRIFRKGYKKVIIIGTDCPQINVNIISKSFEELSQHDVVLGPSSDGGYYLLGMNKYFPYLFDNIEWSSISVLSETIKKIKAKKLEVFMLPRLIDIDTEEDIQKWLSQTEEENGMTDLIDEYGIR